MDKPAELIDPEFAERIRRTSRLTEVAYDAIRDAILTGRIKPGERIMQLELARELGVSERTVREAVARLIASGLAVGQPYKGVRVVALPMAELQEVHTMRALLEGHAMELAAQRIGAEDLACLRELLPLTAAGPDPASIRTAQEMNQKFHWIAIRAAGSPILERVLEQIWQLMFAYNLLYWDPAQIELHSRNDLIQHQILIDALAAGDSERARETSRTHIYSGLQSLMAWHEKQSGAQ